MQPLPSHLLERLAKLGEEGACIYEVEERTGVIDHIHRIEVRRVVVSDAVMRGTLYR